MANKNLSGADIYNDHFYKLAKKKISESDPKYMLDGFYNYIISSKSYSSAYVYICQVANFLKTVDDVTKIDIDNYNAFLATLKNKSSSNQINAYHAIQRYSKYLKAKGVCEDYMQYVERPKFVETQHTKDARERGYMNKEETRQLFDRSISRSGYQRDKGEQWKARDLAILMIFINTGIRCSALYKLDVDDVDFENMTINVLEKGSKYRKIAISNMTVKAIKDWLVYRKEILGDINDNALIISTRRERMTTGAIRSLIKKMGEIFPDKNITPHKLRATFGTQLYAKTKDLYFVQQCMGHSNPVTTELYIRGQKSDQSRHASNLMADFLN